MVLRVNRLCAVMPLTEPASVDLAHLAYAGHKRDLVRVERSQPGVCQSMVLGGVGQAFLAHLRSYPEQDVPKDLLPPRDSLLALIMDRVLEVRQREAFLSGAAGAACLGVNFQRPEPSSPTERLSRAALIYAQALHIKDAHVLSQRLYAYNRLPFCVSSRNNAKSGMSVHARLVMEAGTATRRLLDSKWHASGGAGAWTHYRLAEVSNAERRFHKLYISPQPGFLGYVFGESLRVFTEMRVPSFKIAATETGLLRPDKFVAYLDNTTQQQLVADRLVRDFESTPAHGVPFTAASGSSALVSWGIDPPQARQELAKPATSWRSWITDRLGSAIVDAQATPSELCEAWQFAEERLRCSWVDTGSWAPAQSNQEYEA